MIRNESMSKNRIELERMFRRNDVSMRVDVINDDIIRENRK